MQVRQNLTFPDDVDAPSRRRLNVFKERIWRNAEICNTCFQQIRSIGPAHTKQLSESGRRFLGHGLPLEVTIHEWYERTEHGSQEHTAWDSNKRFGTCFCTDCGSDGGATSETLSVDELKTAGKRIIRYLNRATPYRADPQRFGRVLGKLCTVDENAGYDTEKLAAATALALDSATATTQRATAD